MELKSIRFKLSYKDKACGGQFSVFVVGQLPFVKAGVDLVEYLFLVSLCVDSFEVGYFIYELCMYRKGKVSLRFFFLLFKKNGGRGCGSFSLQLPHERKNYPH